jgi:hypothetical protein
VLGAALAIAAVLATSAPVLAPTPISLRYDVYVGDPTHPAVAGLVWLQRYGWNGGSLKRIGTIREGTASIDFNSDILPRLTHPDPLWDDHFVVAFELSGAQWYLSRPVDPMHFFSDLPAAIETLGRTSDGGPGAPRAIGLAPSTIRTFTFLNDDGTPARIRSVDVAVHVSDANHCGVEEGPSLGSFQPDQKGVISLRSPPVSLFIGATYYKDDGGAYREDFRTFVGAAQSKVLRRTWQIPYQTVALTVLSEGGAPAAGIGVESQVRANMCGRVIGGEAMTDTHGIATLRLQHLIVYRVWIELPGNKERMLTPLEQHLLLSRGSLTIRI